MYIVVVFCAFSSNNIYNERNAKIIVKSFVQMSNYLLKKIIKFIKQPDNINQASQERTKRE